MTTKIDYELIVKYAWMSYDNSREVVKVTDISAKVSTNFVFRIKFKDKGFVIAKVSHFGKYEQFAEDHIIIQTLSNNLPIPFERFLARSLMKGSELYIHRFKTDEVDAWVVFYQAIKIKSKLPKILSEHDIICLGKELASFHKTCHTLRNTLPKSTKTMLSEMQDIRNYFNNTVSKSRYSQEDLDKIIKHCDLFEENSRNLGLMDLPSIPVFVDWNIGNFSVFGSRFYSRWDYDWFRMSTRMMDFYFMSRVVSDRGDKTSFSYDIEPLIGARFIRFLQIYHLHNPLTRNELLLLKECYRFFLINYVLRHGKYFFTAHIADQLRMDVLNTHLDSIAQVDFNELIKLVGI